MALPSETDSPVEGAPGVEDLEAALRPAWVDVDLAALEHNLAQVRGRLAGTGTRMPAIMAVVKADAYGHGAVGVTRALEDAGVDWLGVALLEEGAEIRRAGVEVPILVLGTARPAKIALYRRYRLTPTVSSITELALWRDWTAGQTEAQPIHLKVDTGMGRLGVALEEVPWALEMLRGHPGLRLAGLLSHFGDADDLGSPRNDLQAERFDVVLGLLTEEERGRTILHMANSAAALHRPASRHALVRLGIALYGLDPAERPDHPLPPAARIDLRPVMSVKARIVQVREVPAGTPVSYGGRTVTCRRSRIAVVPVGYADGYAWRLTGKAQALVRGRRVPVAGSVTMDMTLLDVTGAGAELGDEVVLLGRQGAEEITAAELAVHAGTISWEILCHLGLRLPRRFVREGKVEELTSRFSREDW
ncbi:MAG TPA: alanine racemase [Thermoanaerobaculia bacterium]|nr:alanine racemase [Thermoanaerobaculia bacterium]